VRRRLLIVDDDARFRGLVRMLLDNTPEFEVVGEADKGETALDAERELNPEVVLLDVHLPDTTGFELAPQFDADVVITSSRDDSTYGELALKAGARAFVSKHELTPAALIAALA
jgi:DNA-binding NarL/FixJ family response regulator